MPPSSFVVLRQYPVASFHASPPSLPSPCEVALDLNLRYHFENPPKASHHTYTKIQSSPCGWMGALATSLTSRSSSPQGSRCSSHTGFLPVPQTPQTQSHLRAFVFTFLEQSSPSKHMAHFLSSFSFCSHSICVTTPANMLSVCTPPLLALFYIILYTYYSS